MLKESEKSTIAGYARSLESYAEELLEAAQRAEAIEDTDDLDRIVRALRDVCNGGRWLLGDAERLLETAENRDDFCPECEGDLCADCGLCPNCGECDCGFEDAVDDDFPLSLEYPDEDVVEYDRY